MNRLKSVSSRRRGFSLLEITVVLVLIGVVGSISAAYLRPMAQSYSRGRQLVRTADSGRFGLQRMAQLMSRAQTSSIIAGSDSILFNVHTNATDVVAVSISHDAGLDELLLDGEPLLRGVSGYEVTYSNSLIYNRITFGTASNAPLALTIYPRNQ